jgi:hypothetical protein
LRDLPDVAVRIGEGDRAHACCQYCCHDGGQRLPQMDGPGISAQKTATRGRYWTTCPSLRIRWSCPDTADGPVQTHRVSSTTVRHRAGRRLVGENFPYVFKGARSAPCAVGSVIPREEARGLAREVTGGHAQRGGHYAPAGTLRHLAGSPAFAPAAHGELPPVRYPGHRPSPASDHHARGPLPAQEWPSSRHSSLEPTKITVKSAPACGPRVTS